MKRAIQVRGTVDEYEFGHAPFSHAGAYRRAS
jgi:hypothetical protein